MSRRAGSNGCAPRTPTAADPPGGRADDELVRSLLARATFPAAGSEMTCAVSGGADSSALLVLAVAAGCRVEAIHVDHGLRPGGPEEAARVAALAGTLGARFRARAVQVAPGGNLEARARAARYAVLPPDVATGHTADDQAETVLLNQLRGAGLDGLAGMRPGPRHPLLGLRRAETRALCDQLGLDVLDDPSNRDRRHARNRVRHELLPLLAELSGRDPVPLLCRQATHLRAAADQLRASAAELEPSDARALAAAPIALAEVAVREWLRPLDPERHPPDSATIARVLDVARGAARATEVGGGASVRRSGGRLVLVAPSTGATEGSAGSEAGIGGSSRCGAAGPTD